jgi:hypothetical protein
LVHAVGGMEYHQGKACAAKWVTNKLPRACNQLEATRNNTGNISMQEHETIMEEAERHNRLEYNDNNGSEEDKGEDNDDNED